MFKLVIQPAEECATSRMPHFLQHIHPSKLEKGYSDQSRHPNQAGTWKNQSSATKCIIMQQFRFFRYMERILSPDRHTCRRARAHTHIYKYSLHINISLQFQHIRHYLAILVPSPAKCFSILFMKRTKAVNQRKGSSLRTEPNLYNEK